MALFKQKEGNSFRYNITQEIHTESALPVEVFSLEYDDRAREFYLTQQQKFQLPDKLYGDFSIVERWKTAWANTRKNMGILLTGIKGSGKTITAQKFCIEMNMPVILINRNYSSCVHQLQNFLGSPEISNSIVFIDEYEKHYSAKDSDQMLAVFDGVMHSRLVFLLTVNTSDKLSEYMVNRLNRIRYKKDYQSLNEEIIKEVATDLLKNMDHLESLYTVFDKVGICTFDLLTEIIREMNIFNEDAISVAKHLCLEQESVKYSVYEFFNSSLTVFNELIFRMEELPGSHKDFHISRDLYELDYKDFPAYSLLPGCPEEFVFEKLAKTTSEISKKQCSETDTDLFYEFKDWVYKYHDTFKIPAETPKISLGSGVYMYELGGDHRVFFVRKKSSYGMWSAPITDQNLIVKKYSEYRMNQMRNR